LRAANKHFYENLTNQLRKQTFLPGAYNPDRIVTNAARYTIWYKNPNSYDTVYIKRTVNYTCPVANVTANGITVPSDKIVNGNTILVLSSQYGYKRNLRKKPGSLTVSIQNFWPILKPLCDNGATTHSLLIEVYEDKDCKKLIDVKAEQLDRATVWTVKPNAYNDWLNNKGALAYAIASYKGAQQRAIKGKMNRLKWGPQKMLKAIEKMAK
jgi:hypothetical protein